MPNLTSKELSAISDQLGFEKTLCAKYEAAAQECTDQGLKTSFQTYAGQHKQNFDCLLNHLK